MASSFQISAFVRKAAAEAGFEACGISPVRDFAELAHFPEWIAKGRAGEMKYMEARDDSGQLKRASLRSAAPWARSVIVCAMNYNTDHPYSTAMNDPQRGWIARYAWGREDYHDSVLSKLRGIEAKLNEFIADENLTSRCYVDTGPLVERVYAKYAGVGWIGKNTCIINQKLGSWLFLGVILTSLELESVADIPAPDRCGTCIRCIDACPTDALLAPYQLDATKCISYLTIEKRGEIPEEMREGMGRHVFGCDICQDVCPWNRKSPASAAPEFQPREGLVNPALAWLAEISEEEFREKFRGSAIRRAKRTGLRRNAVIAMGNSGDTTLLSMLEKLSEDEDPVIRDHAQWARNNLERKLADRLPANQGPAESGSGSI
ncbi:MAG TPA: tRNA epoxyqueuosine(34) reductase QueG [Terriglobales bacterium]|nr:tRNA epoxyqueuosine(34) reductase QueG [Terriglobales bacterium]